MSERSAVSLPTRPRSSRIEIVNKVLKCRGDRRTTRCRVCERGLGRRFSLAAGVFERNGSHAPIGSFFIPSHLRSPVVHLHSVIVPPQSFSCSALTPVAPSPSTHHSSFIPLSSSSLDTRFLGLLCRTPSSDLLLELKTLSASRASPLIQHPSTLFSKFCTHSTPPMQDLVRD